MAKDQGLQEHLDWLGYLQPVGLVVSPFALLDAQAHVDRNVFDLQQRFLNHTGDAMPAVRDLPRFCRDVLGWRDSDLVAGPPLEVVLTDYHETLRPTFAVPDGAGSWLLLAEVVGTGVDLDRPPAAEGHGWHASPQAKFERLLRDTHFPLGLLSNGTHLRLVYAPRGKSSGHVTFPVKAMSEVAGRPILGALHMLLGEYRLFSAPEKQRLPAILAASRRFQNLVSTRLAGQVLEALYELLRGFQAADDQRHGDLLRDVLARDPDQVYACLLSVLLRLVFLLYAEDRGLMPAGAVYANHYAVTGLFEQLRTDSGRYPDTMDQRFGAWARLVTLFRLVHDGGRHGDLHLPARAGHLFDPDRYAFLEGRPFGSQRQPGVRLDVPLVPDGVIWRVLEKLLILDGERLAYRSLDVEQIGSVYETMMGFRLEQARGRSIAVKPAKAHGAPSAIDLDELLTVVPAKRNEWLKERTDQALTGAALTALKDAKTVEAIVAALGRKVALEATPRLVPPGAMVLQPSDERRRSGSHYTPRSLTQPIVEKTLRPVLERLGPKPTPDQILSLKVCDPAMGSAAFLVESCRYLSEALVSAWHAHDCVPKNIPPDEDELLHARRLIAQRCLYGVDKNPLAVDLGKLSLWLATLAKDHPFTFLDHALKHGDSLVGLTQEGIRRFHWKPGVQQMLVGQEDLDQRLRLATNFRKRILDAGDEMSPLLKRQELMRADEALGLLRFAGNLVVAAFFSGDNDKRRQSRRDGLLARLTEYLQTGDMGLRPTTDEAALLSGERPVVPFHWEIEFPEVFGRSEPPASAGEVSTPSSAIRRLRARALFQKDIAAAISTG